MGNLKETLVKAGYVVAGTLVFLVLVFLLYLAVGAVLHLTTDVALWPFPDDGFKEGYNYLPKSARHRRRGGYRGRRGYWGGHYRRPWMPWYWRTYYYPSTWRYVAYPSTGARNVYGRPGLQTYYL